MSRSGDAYMEMMEREYEKSERRRRDYFYQVYGYAPPDDDDFEINEEDALMYEEERSYWDSINNSNNTRLTEETKKVSNNPLKEKDWLEYEDNSEVRTPIEEVALDFVKNQTKLEILETNDWWLPIPVYTIKYQLTKFQPINLIEEYVLRCINQKELKLDSIDEMIETLRIDEVFIKPCLQEMISNGLIIKSETKEYNLTEEGKTALETGKEQIAVRTEKLVFANKPSLGLQIYDENLLLQANETLPVNEKHCNYD